MGALGWILIFGILMSCIALVGSVTLVLSHETLDRLLLPLVAFAAGSLIGGAFFHMVPVAVREMQNGTSVYVWLVTGFVLFLALEQFLNWHHSHAATVVEKHPQTYLILIADALHNFIGGLFVAASFLVSTELGVVAWLAAAAHEVPQELGDFGILVHGGWSRGQALFWNFVSASTFLLGGVVAYAVSAQIDVVFLIPFAAGSFIYIAAADLIPEIKKSHSVKTNLVHFAAFNIGWILLLVVRTVLPHGH